MCLTATVLVCDDICRPRLTLPSPLGKHVDNERRVLEACCARASLYVDVPIDLGPLLNVINPKSQYEAKYYWQLVRRPIDQAFRGLMPLADSLGYPVARIANLLHRYHGGGLVGLNRNLFETYPAMCLERISHTNKPVRRIYNKYRWLNMLKATDPWNWPKGLRQALRNHHGDRIIPDKVKRKELGEEAKKELGERKKKLVALVLEACSEQKSNCFSKEVKREIDSEIDSTAKPPYKEGEARFQQSVWVPEGENDNDRCLAELMTALGFRANPGDDTFNADEFDSVMCSVVGCFSNCRMPESDLKKIVRERLNVTKDEIADDLLVPTGYSVLSTWPDELSIVLERKEFATADDLCKYLKANGGG
jgi:hypothetical protein